MNFLSFKYSRNDLRIDELTKKVISDYEEYLHSTMIYSHNNLIKYLRWLQRATQKAIECDTLIKDPFNGISYNEVETDRGFLDERDLATLMKASIKEKHLNLVRDAFVFSCFTGLAYCDVQDPCSNNITYVNNEAWILVRRKKTKVLSQIPLLPQASAVLEKYKDKGLKDGRLLPLPCNQVINRQLKEVQRLSGIDKKLTFHLARHNPTSFPSYNQSITINLLPTGNGLETS